MVLSCIRFHACMFHLHPREVGHMCHWQIQQKHKHRKKVQKDFDTCTLKWFHSSANINSLEKQKYTDRWLEFKVAITYRQDVHSQEIYISSHSTWTHECITYVLIKIHECYISCRDIYIKSKGHSDLTLLLPCLSDYTCTTICPEVFSIIQIPSNTYNIITWIICWNPHMPGQLPSLTEWVLFCLFSY